MKDSLLACVGWVVMLGSWAAVTETRLVDPLFVAPPSATFQAIVAGIASGEFIEALGATLARAVGGFLVATAVGVPLGLLLGGVPRFRLLFGSVVDGLRSMPATALFPAFILVFGIGDRAKVAVAAFVCTWAMAVYTASGVQGSGDARRFLLRLHNVSRTQFFLDGLFYPALPSILGGMRACLSLALVVTIATEMIVGTRTGLGQTIYTAQITFRTPVMYAAIMLAAVAGMLMNLSLHLLTRWVVHWERQ